MTLTLDHVVIAVNNLEQAMADYRELGFTVINGGNHASGTTHNALICFKDGTYLELLAPTGEAPKAVEMDFSHLLQYGEGLVAYALVSDDLEADAMVLRERGIEVGEIAEGGRKRADGIELRWKTALIDGGMSPFLIEDITPRNLRVPDDEETTTHVNAIYGIFGVLIAVTSLSAETLERYTRLLGSAPEHSEMFQQVIFQIGQSQLDLRPVDSLTQDTNALSAHHNEMMSQMELFKDELSKHPEFDPQKMSQMMSEGHQFVIEELLLHHQVAMNCFAALGGKDAAYGVALRATTVSKEPITHPYEFGKTHNVLFMNQLDLSVLPPDEDDETRTGASHLNSNIPF